MANLNERNSQILGLLGLMGGIMRDNKFYDNKPKGKHASKQESFFDKSERTRTTIRKYGIEKPSLTYARITGMPKMFSKIADAETLMRHVTLRAERVTQPGLQLATSGIRRYGVGPVEKKPFSAATTDVNISFIGDARGVIHQFFYVWLNGIVNAYNLPDGAGERDIFGKLPYEVEYRSDYRSTIDLIMYDEERLEINQIRLHNAYPIAVGEIQRDWAGINDLVRVNVSFAFTHWSYTGNLLAISEPSMETLASQKSSFIDSAIKGLSGLQAITAIKRPQNVNDILNVVNTGSTLLSAFLPMGPGYYDLKV